MAHVLAEIKTKGKTHYFATCSKSTQSRAPAHIHWLWRPEARLEPLSPVFSSRWGDHIKTKTLFGKCLFQSSAPSTCSIMLGPFPGSWLLPASIWWRRGCSGFSQIPGSQSGSQSDAKSTSTHEERHKAPRCVQSPHSAWPFTLLTV